MIINKSKTYLLPLLLRYINLKFINNILNTYLYIENRHEEENIFIISYQFQNCEEFIKYEKDLKLSRYYLDTIDDNDTVSYVFKLPEQLKFEYNLFIDGKYSEFRNEKKREILVFIIKLYGKVNKLHNDVHGVLYKTMERRFQLEKELNVKISNDAELSSIPNKIEETYKKKNT